MEKKTEQKELNLYTTIEEPKNVVEWKDWFKAKHGKFPSGKDYVEYFKRHPAEAKRLHDENWDFAQKRLKKKRGR